MRRFLLAAALILVLPMAAAAGKATETGWTKVTMPANDGFVLSFKIPPGWAHKFHGSYRRGVRKNDAPIQVLSMSIHHPDREHSISLYMYAYPSTLSLEDLVEGTFSRERWAKITLQTGFDQSFGRRSFSRTVSYSKKSTDPFSRDAMTIFHDRVAITANYKADSGYFEKLAGPFDRIIRSVAVTPVADLDAGTVRRHYVSPKVLVTPGKYWLDAGFSLVMPPGWESEEVEIAAASKKGARGGRMVVDFFAPSSPDDPAFTVVLDGILYSERLSAAQFLATREPILALIATGLRETETEPGVALPGDDFWPGWTIMQDGFCLYKSRTRRFTRSGKIEVKTYTGTDAVTGVDLKLRTHTAGGVTLACNLIFRAPPEDFDRLAPEVGAMIRSVKVESGGLIMLK